MIRNGCARFAPWGVVAITLVLFWPSLQYDFINLDDPYLVLNNPDLFRKLSFDALFAPVAGLYHPLTNLTYWLDVQLHGGSAGGFHATNLFFHLIGVLGIFWWSANLSGSRIAATFLAAAFAWHPTHVESVVWVSERKDVLSVAFFWLALCAHLRGLETEKRSWWLLFLLSSALSLAAKPFAVTLPAIIVAVECYRSRSPWLATLRERWKVLAMLLAMGAAASISAIRAQSAVRATTDPSLTEIPLNIAFQLLFYFEKTVWPFALQVLYLHQDAMPTFTTVISVTILLGVYAFCAWKYSSFRMDLKFGFFFFIVILAPMLKILPFGDNSLVADRYLYVSQTGLLWPFAMAMGRLSFSWVVVPTTAVLAFWMYGTWDRLPDWENSETMWYSLIRAQPSSKEGHEYLGRHLMGMERHEEALVHFRQGMVEHPDNMYNQAFSLLRLGLRGPSDEKLRMAEKFKPNDPQILNLRGNWYLESGDLARAETYFRLSLEVPAKLLTALIQAEAMTNIGVLRYRQGSAEECLEWQARALTALPGYLYALYNQALCNWNLKRGEQAIAGYLEVLRRQPKFPMAQNGLGVIYFERGDYPRAIEHFKAALSIDPSLEVARNNLRMTEAKLSN